MQKWLDNNDILIYSTHSEDKSVIAERFMKTLKAKIYKKMTTNDNISYLPYLIKLVDQCNNTYHYSINKKPINADNLLWLKKVRPILKLLRLNLITESESISIRIFLAEVTVKVLSREIFIIDSVSKTNLWNYKIKDLNGEKIIGSFYEKGIVVQYIINELLSRTR